MQIIYAAWLRFNLNRKACIYFLRIQHSSSRMTLNCYASLCSVYLNAFRIQQFVNNCTNQINNFYHIILTLECI